MEVLGGIGCELPDRTPVEEAQDTWSEDKEGETQATSIRDSKGVLECDTLETSMCCTTSETQATSSSCSDVPDALASSFRVRVAKSMTSEKSLATSSIVSMLNVSDILLALLWRRKMPVLEEVKGYKDYIYMYIFCLYRFLINQYYRHAALDRECL